MSSPWLRALFGSSLLVFLLVGLACRGELDAESFRREAEKAYVEVHPGWGIVRREGERTTYVRGDQVDTLDVGALFDEYKTSKKSGSAFFDDWKTRATEEAKARRRTLEQAKGEVIPIVKSGSWVRVQDLGAIGPPHLQDRIRPWRKDVATEVFMLLGVPEERLGYRFASVEEVRAAPEGEDAWIARAVSNLRARVGTSTASELRDAEGRLLVYDLSGVRDVSGLILDARFRAEMLEKFGRDELGAATPIRDVLIVFESGNFAATKPVRARTHQLFDTQNHPAFRGLLRFDRTGLSVLEAAGSP